MAPIKPLSVDAQILYRKLADMQVGEEVTYGELSALISVDVQGRGKGILESARRVAQRDNKMVFGILRGRGLRRLGDVEIVDKGIDGIAKARRVVRRHARILTCVSDFDSMPEPQKVKHNTVMSMLGAVDQGLRPSTFKRMEAAVSSGGLVPVSKTLDLFAGRRDSA